jgi:hypothetical protein
MDEKANIKRSAYGPNTAAQAIANPIAAQADRALETAKDKLSMTAEQMRGFDLRQQVDAQPLAAVGVALVAGYMLGSMGGQPHEDDRAHKPTPYDSADRHRSTRTYPYGDSAQRAHDDQRGGMWGEIVGQVSGELHTITAAAMSTAMTMLRDTIKEAVPQFSEEYERRSPSTERNATPLGDAPPVDGFNGGPTRIGNGGMRTTSDPGYVDRSQPIDPAI